MVCATRPACVCVCVDCLACVSAWGRSSNPYQNQNLPPHRKREGQQNGALLLNMGEYAYRHSADDNTTDVLGKVLTLEFG